MKTWHRKNQTEQLNNVIENKEIEKTEYASMQGTALCPLQEINGYMVRPGFYRMNGAFQTQNGVSFTVSSHHAVSCTLLLYEPHAAEPFAEIPIPQEYRIGDSYSILVCDLKMDAFEYAYRFDGPNDPEKGLKFDPENVILDPYARAVTGQRDWGEKPEGGKPFQYRARVVKNDFDWGTVGQLNTPLEDLVIYETHVRGFTKDESSGVEAKGTFEGLREKIPYLKDLGINAVELMPIFEFDEMESARVVDGVQLYNYWGYNTVSFFAPNTGFAHTDKHHHEGEELKRLIYDLKKNGIEVILDVVFNHTAEGNEMGPSFSFKGIDNNIYYMLTPDAKYYNFSGCGNVMNCNHPIVRSFILDCLRHWVVEYRVDGFRFDLASILGRDQNGVPMTNPPILEALAFDSVLSKTKLIAEAWDAAGLYQVGSFPSWNRWAEWNGKYRDDMRRFLKGDMGSAGGAVVRITGSTDLYSPEERGHSASVNFITCHDGFTMYDLYSYNYKHNEKNGWNNTDGDNNGHSWNCGCEGETTDAAVIGLRHRLIKNAFAALLCSRGAAMFFAGDEFCNTQFGNNNAYCQDNIISWLDWNRLTQYKEIHDFVRYMIAFRKAHPVIRKNTKPSVCQMPAVSVHNGYPYNGTAEYNTHMIGVMFTGRNEEDTKDDIVFYCMNSYWEPLTLQLPSLSNSMVWRVKVNTNCVYEDGMDYDCMTEKFGPYTFRVPARSTLVFVAE